MKQTLRDEWTKWHHRRRMACRSTRAVDCQIQFSNTRMNGRKMAHWEWISEWERIDPVRTFSPDWIRDNELTRIFKLLVRIVIIMVGEGSEGSSIEEMRQCGCEVTWSGSLQTTVAEEQQRGGDTVTLEQMCRLHSPRCTISTAAALWVKRL